MYWMVSAWTEVATNSTTVEQMTALVLMKSVSLRQDGGDGNPIQSQVQT